MAHLGAVVVVAGFHVLQGSVHVYLVVVLEVEPRGVLEDYLCYVKLNGVDCHLHVPVTMSCCLVAVSQMMRTHYWGILVQYY